MSSIKRALEETEAPAERLLDRMGQLRSMSSSGGGGGGGGSFAGGASSGPGIGAVTGERPVPDLNATRVVPALQQIVTDVSLLRGELRQLGQQQTALSNTLLRAST